jgi:hypothetical protein
VLVAFCWTKSLLCNVVVFTGMLLYPESTLQLCSSRRFCEVFKEVYFGSLSAVRTTWLYRQDAHQLGTSVWTTWYSVQTLICQSIIRPDDENFPSRRLSVSRSFKQFKIATVRTTWLYRPDAIQCLTSIRVSSSRHSYGKTATTVRTMFSIR